MKAVHLCETTVCLTLRGQRERQQSAAAGLQSVGIDHFEFFHGVTADDAKVRHALASGAVKAYPPCFRCGQEDCGDPNCNNILLPVQVAVAISFREVFRHCLESGCETMAICEDDIVFAGYAKKVFGSADYGRVLDESGLFSRRPTLIRLGSPRRPDHFFDTDYDGTISAGSAVTMSNYMFLCNRPFAELAHQRLDVIDHTADVIIHQGLRDTAHCLTLSPQLVCDQSWALRTAPSLIHPKPEYLEHLRQTAGVEDPRFRQEEERLRRHRKKARCFRHAFVGLMNCDFQAVVRSCLALGLDIGDGVPGRDGFAAWQYTSTAAIPLLEDPALSDPFFVHVHHFHLVFASPWHAIMDLERRISNQDASVLQALAITEQAAPGGPARVTASDLDRAVSLYISWHHLARTLPLESVIHDRDTESDMALALAGAGRPSRHAVGQELARLTPRIGPALAHALETELKALGFDLH